MDAFAGDGLNSGAKSQWVRRCETATDEGMRGVQRFPTTCLRWLRPVELRWGYVSLAITLHTAYLDIHRMSIEHVLDFFVARTNAKPVSYID